MNLRTIFCGIGLVAVTAFVTSSFVAAGPNDAKNAAKHDHDHAGHDHGDPAHAMEHPEWTQPGENHGLLVKTFEGQWNYATKYWIAPEETPMESTGTSKMTAVMDGRYIVDHSSGGDEHTKFVGMGVTGFDRIKNKFVSTWVDNMGTGIMYSEGLYDAKTKSFTFNGQAPDPMTGKYAKVKIVHKITGKDRFTMEMHKYGAGGGEWKFFEINYTRAN